MVDPATASVIASGMAQMGQAAPAMSSTAPQNASVYVEGMQIPGQAAAGWSALVWPAAFALVAVVWLRRG